MNTFLAPQDTIRMFRHCAPYINAHRGKTCVIVCSGEAVEHANFATIIHDIALLSSLGVRLILVHGARPQIEQRIDLRGLAPRMYRDVRITDKRTLESVKDAVGSVRSHIEALLTMGLANSPMHGAQIRVCSGNMVIARPIGVQEGIDYEYTGRVRRIDAASIEAHLDDGAIILLSPIGYSSTGEVFNLAHEDVATETAIALGVDKLIFFCSAAGLTDGDGKLLRNVDFYQLSRLLEQHQLPAQSSMLNAIYRSLAAGVARCHCVSYQEDGALLQELFTRDGGGTLISQQYYEQIRTARIDDVGGILKLIQPLEEQGVLVKRSRERLEAEIDYFTVIERDGAIIACAALYPYPDYADGEIACVATHPDYRGAQRGERLLEALLVQAKEQQLQRVFVLSTVTGHWFLERGFTETDIASLPPGKQHLYNFQRNSKVFQTVLQTGPSDS